MDGDRWRQIDRLFEAALEIEPAARAGYLAKACAGDEEMRREVEELLATEADPGNLQDAPTVDAAALLTEDEQPATMSGRELGHYRLISLLGAGGMGEIYLAEDARLRRRVALKLLPVKFTHDEARLRRFKREARAVSSLNHPNILTIHDIGQSDGIHFIATEFVEGHTLRHMLREGAFTLSDALEIAIQIAGALEAAHRTAVIHRDIKPENIMVRPDRLVKVLDFGLAKLTERKLTHGAEAITPTAFITQPGSVMGTPRYMSPEQARGLKVDPRTDIYSLGVVLYEMIAGLSPFGGETPADIMVAVLHYKAPPIANYRPGVPDELQRIVSKAMAKDPVNRYQTVTDLISDLKLVRAKVELDHAPAEPRRGVETGSGETGRVTLIVDSGDKKTSPLLAAAPEQISPDSAEPSSKRSVRWKMALTALLVILPGIAMLIALSSTLPGNKTAPAAGAASVRTIAVLPFREVSSDGDEYGLGLTEALIMRLSRLKRFKVRPTSAVLKYNGREQDPAAAGRDLEVEWVIEGSVRKSGEIVRVTVQQVSVDTGLSLWSETFDEKAADMFVVEDRISENIAEALTLNLTSEEKAQMARRYTESVEAYAAYLTGRAYWNKRTPESIKKSFEHFERATLFDPSFALAYAGLADSYALLGFRLYNAQPPHEVFPKAKAAAKKALELDDQIAEAHTSLGLVMFRYEWDWAGAEAEFKRAIELDPGYATAHQWYSDLLISAGRFQEAVDEIRVAREADPSSLIIRTFEAAIFYYGRDYGRAIEVASKAIEANPEFFVFHLILGQSYQQAGRNDEGLARIVKVAPQMAEGVAEGALGYAYAKAGRRAESMKLLDKLQRRSSETYIGAIYMAQVYCGLQEADRTLEWLEKALEERATASVYLKVNPRYDWLRTNVRFQSLLHRMGL